MKRIRVVAAVVRRGQAVLVTRRPDRPGVRGQWEFPGGKVEAGETDAEALRREALERLGVEVEVGQLISFVSHPYENYTVDLHLYECKLQSEALQARAVNDFRWVTSSEFDQYQFTPADEASMTKLLGVSV